MAETSIIIDKDLRPAYWDDFHCVMGACRHNCCDDSWGIKFSKQDYLKVKRAPKSPEMEELTGKCLRRLRDRGTENYYAEFHSSESGRCAFHTPEGLCRLQLECGEETLPRVCRVFPRSEGYMSSGYLERSLSPACEGVLALLWDLPEGIEFRSDPLRKEQHKKVPLEEGDRLLLWFPVVREWCIDVLQDRRYTLPQRIFLMGMGLRELADGEENIERWMKRAAALRDSVGASVNLPDGKMELGMYLSICAQTLIGMRKLDSNGKAAKEELLEGMKLEADPDTNELSIPLDPYQEARSRYEEQFGDRDYFMENLMVSVFFRFHFPHMTSREDLWKSYVSFCNLYAMFRFTAVMSCREGAAGDRDELFRLMVFVSRTLIHNRERLGNLRDDYFKNDSASLAHMAILLCG